MKFKVSDHFKLVQKEIVKEFKTKSYLYEHIKTGAKVLYYDAPNPNSTFSIYFPTPVENSRGISHILEHCVFEGSKKFPHTGNFDFLINKSLASYLNAGTFQDKTMYYFASSFEKDYFNLLDMYLDFVFFPILDEKIFQREGFFLRKNSENNYEFNGIVFNEMKDSLLSFDNKSFYSTMRNLFPGSTFSHEQGGDPVEITHLTVQDIRDYHEKYYHPSNSYTILYGDIDHRKVFEKLNQYFDQFESRSFQILEVPVSVSSPILAEEEYQEFEENSSGNLAISYSFGSTNQETNYQLFFLVELLLRSKYSPLKKALEESNLFESLLDYQYDNRYRNSYLMIRFKGVPEENRPKIKKLIEETLHSLSKGIDKYLKETLVRSFEFDLKETSFVDNQGLEWTMAVSSDLMNRLDDINFHFKNLQILKLYQKLCQGKKLEMLIKKYFLNNSSNVELYLRPNPSLILTYSSKIEKRLNGYLQGISDFSELDNKIFEFESWKNQPATEFVYTNLKEVKSSDLDPKILTFDRQLIGKSLVTKLPVNDLCSVSLIFDVSSLEGINTDYLGIYMSCVLFMPTQNYSFTKFLSERSKYFSYFNLSFRTFENFETRKKSLAISLNYKYLHRDFAKAKSLINEFIQNLRFDDLEHLKNNLIKTLSDAKFSLDSDPGHFAESHIAKLLSNQGFLYDKMFGFDFLTYLDYVLRNFSELENSLAEEMRKLHTAIFASPVFLSCATSDRFVDALVTDQESLLHENNLTQISKDDFGTYTNPQFFMLEKQSFSFKGNSDTNFNHEGLKYEPWSVEDFPKLSFLRDYLQYYFIKKIRLSAGAYGARASFDSFNSILYLSSYSDPNISKTYSVFEEYLGKYNVKSFPKEDFEKIKIKILSKFQKQFSPDVLFASSTSHFLENLTDDLKRKEIATKELFNYSDLESLLEKFTKPIAKVKFTCSSMSSEEISKNTGEEFYEVKPFARNNSNS